MTPAPPTEPLTAGAALDARVCTALGIEPRREWRVVNTKMSWLYWNFQEAERFVAENPALKAEVQERIIYPAVSTDAGECWRVLVPAMREDHFLARRFALKLSLLVGNRLLDLFRQETFWLHATPEEMCLAALAALAAVAGREGE
jgi:hypothetical protein